MKLKILATAAACAMAFSMAAIPAFATSSGSINDVPVMLVSEAATFSVTAPTQLGVYVDATGKISTTTTATITNNSSAPVEITDVDVRSSGNFNLMSWSTLEEVFGDYGVDSDVVAFKINEKDALALQPSDLYTDGYIGMNENNSVDFTYDALVTPRTTGDTCELVDIVFVFDWYSGDQSMFAEGNQDDGDGGILSILG